MTSDTGTHRPSIHEQLESDTYGDPLTGGEHHGATDKQYIIIALVLAAITAAEVSISYIDIGPLFLPVLLILMAIKFFVVVSWFMHLRFDNKIFTMAFYTGLGLAVFVYAAALSTFHFFNK